MTIDYPCPHPQTLDDLIQSFCKNLKYAPMPPAPWLGAVRRELLAVLRGIAAATMPLPANDENLRLLRAG